MSIRGLFIAAAVLAAVGCDRSRVAAAVEIGRPAPAYVTTALDGDSVSLAAQRGQVVLLNIWATWCHPCRDEVPVLEELHRRHAARGLRVIGVSIDAAGEERAIRRFARDFAMTYPIWRDADERISSLVLALGVPTTLLVGRDGTVLWRHTGPVRRDDPALGQLIERALADTTAAT